MGMVATYLRLIGAVIFMMGGGIYFYINYTVYNHASAVTAQMREHRNPTDPMAGGNLTIVNKHQRDGRSFRHGYKEFARFNDIKARRYLKFSATVSIQELMRSGESRPTKSMEGVFAQTRAIFYAREECTRILKIFARQCEVDSVRGKAKDGMVQIIATLRFVQSAKFGNLDPKVTWAFQTATTNLKTKKRAQVSVRAEQRTRMKLYKQAVKECESIRRREGNCAITSLSIRSSHNSANRKVRLSGQARYAFLTSASG